MVTGELNSEHPQEELKSLDLSKNIIPSDTVLSSLRCSFIPLVAHVLIKYLPAYKEFKDVNIHHIPHKYSKEMAQQSQEVN